MQARHSLATTALLLGAFSTTPSFAQNRFAATVVSFTQGTGSGIFDVGNILGETQGAGVGSGSLHVLTLGTGGEITLGFDVVITDGPGADFIVSENPFAFGAGTFAEVVAVEVSSNGVDFARFPTRYSGPVGPLGGFAALPFGAYWNRPGGMPVQANALTNMIDPFDPVVAGGDALDLAELANEPLVLSGLVDLSAITRVRLIDEVSGTNTDSRGFTIWDSGGDSSADIDSVAVIQHTQNQSASGPVVDLWRDTQGFTHLVIEDPDGYSDLDLNTLQVSVNLVPVAFGRLRDNFVLQSSSAAGLHLITPLPASATSFRAVLAVSVRDNSGAFAADQTTLNQ